MAEELIPIALFLMTFGIVYIFFNTRKQERLALIEKGMDATIFEGNKTPRKFRLLQFGLLLVGVSLGLFFGYLLSAYTVMEEEVAFFMMIFLFGGLALLAAYGIISKSEQETEN